MLEDIKKIWDSAGAETRGMVFGVGGFAVAVVILTIGGKLLTIALVLLVAFLLLRQQRLLDRVGDLEFTIDKVANLVDVTEEIEREREARGRPAPEPEPERPMRTRGRRR